MERQGFSTRKTLAASTTAPLQLQHPTRYDD